ncbi:hypothetical protein PG997_015089 [Apiospora hydei]|uniref:Peptidase C14 caspase domain-containing protein n=1 Tax=Apiospora hydei TaxID=1337664 RepID=A0ABR1UWE2_9PEZI
MGDRDDTWSIRADGEYLPGENNIWLQEMSRALPGAEIMAYGYAIHHKTRLSGLLDPDQLESQVRALSQTLGAHLSCHHTAADTQVEVDDDQEVTIDQKFRRPILVLAHGYGGLIYEQALDLANPQNGKQCLTLFFDFFKDRYQLAFLFGTPHFPAGLGEWAIISVTKHRMTPEWAALPAFIPMVIRADHRGMTKPKPENPDLKRVFRMVEAWTSDMKAIMPSITRGIRRFALLVGADHYDNGHPGQQRISENGTPFRLRDLHGCSNDIDLIDVVLEKHFDIHEKVILVSSPGKDQYKTQPTFRNIKQQFHKLSQRVCEGDVFYFHFSGLGALLTPADAQSEHSREEEHIFPMDYCLGEPAIRVNQLLACLEELGSRGVQVFAFLDASFGTCIPFGQSSVRTNCNRAPHFDSAPCNGEPDHETFQKEWAHQDRRDTPGDGVESPGVTYLSSCAAEGGVAFEVPQSISGGSERMYGLCTFLFYEQLHNVWCNGEVASYQALCGTAFGKVKHMTRAEARTQRPRLLGQGDKLFLGDREHPLERLVLSLKIVDQTATMSAGSLHGIKAGMVFISRQVVPFITFTVEDVKAFTSMVRINKLSSNPSQDGAPWAKHTLYLRYMPEELTENPETFSINPFDIHWPEQYSHLKVTHYQRVADDYLEVFVDADNRVIKHETGLLKQLKQRYLSEFRVSPISMRDWESLRPRNGVLMKYNNVGRIGEIERDGLDVFFEAGKAISR